MEKVIECKNITHYYGEKLIYENLNFEVEKGKVCLLYTSDAADE